MKCQSFFNINQKLSVNDYDKEAYRSYRYIEKKSVTVYNDIFLYKQLDFTSTYWVEDYFPENISKFFKKNIGAFWCLLTKVNFDKTS